MVHCLPMNDARFVAKLCSHQFLPGDTESQLETKTTPAAKAAYFLSHVVKRALDGNDTSSFNNLLSVMEICDYTDLNKLAHEIKSKINKASDIEPGITLPDHHCYEPKLDELMENYAELLSDWKSIAWKLKILEHETEVIEKDYNNLKDRCNKMFGIWLQKTARPCWCHYVEALRAVKLHNLAERLTATYLKQRSVSADVTVSSIDNVVENKDNTLNHPRLMKHLRKLTDSKVLDCDITYFAICLLGKATEAAKAIKCSDGSREDKINKICEAFLKKESASWNKVHEALENAEFHDLAGEVKTCYLD